MRFRWIKRNLFDLTHSLHSDGCELQEGITSLVRDCLSGSWYNANPSNLNIKKISGGFNNTIFQVTLDKLNQNNLNNEPKTVILRFHEPLNCDSIFEHLSELLAFMFLSERKLGPKLHAVFPGGRIEEYIDARPLTTKELIDGKFTLGIAEKMALFHSLNPPLTRKKGIMFDVMDKWLKQIKMENFCWKINNSDAEKCVEFFKELDLTKEISWLRKFFEKVDSPIIFCHNDVQEGNILVTMDADSCKKPNITLIDYEFCFYNYQAFDLANHFLEYTMSYEPVNYPNFVINEGDYPSQHQQLLFIRRYLAVKEHLEKMRKDENCSGIPINVLLETMPDDADARGERISEQSIKLLDEVSKFQLASHLFWGIWGALRSPSHISFGYWEYCDARLKAYYKLKKELKD